MANVFFSYSHKDKAFVKRLVSDLKEVGVRVWIDEAEIKLGESLIDKIRAAIDRMEFVVAILSESSVNSPWVRKELDIAMNQEIEGRRIKVLPLMIGDVELPGFLKGKLYGDFRQDISYAQEFYKLLEVLGVEDWILHKKDDTGIGELNNRIGLQILRIDVGDKKQQSIKKSLEYARRHRQDIDYFDDYAWQTMDAALYEVWNPQIEKANKDIIMYEALSLREVSFHHAFEFFYKSARFGDPEGMWNLGWRYWLGEGVLKDRSRALLWWKQAALKGHGPAAQKLSELSTQST